MMLPLSMMLHIRRRLSSNSQAGKSASNVVNELSLTSETSAEGVLVELKAALADLFDRIRL